MYSHMHTSFYNVIHNTHSHRKHVASIVYSPKMQPSNSNPTDFSRSQAQLSIACCMQKLEV